MRMYPASATRPTPLCRSAASAAAAKPFAARIGDHAMRDPGAGGAFEPRRLRAVADHEDDFGRIGRIGGGIDQRLQVRPAARDQNAKFEPGHCSSASGGVSQLRADRAASAWRRIMASHRKLRYHRQRRGGNAARVRDRGRSAMTLPLTAASAGSEAGGGLPASCSSPAAACSGGRSPARAQEADPFSATVKVDAGADTAAKARETARLDGQRRALAAIAERLSGGGAPAKPPKLDDKAITDLVASFEVANERMSAVRYMADYTFHFRPAETRRVLGVAAQAPAPCEPASRCCRAAADPSQPAGQAERRRRLRAKPMVIVPVYQSAGQHGCGTTRTRGARLGSTRRRHRAVPSSRSAMPAISPRSTPTRRAPEMPTRSRALARRNGGDDGGCRARGAAGRARPPERA